MSPGRSLTPEEERKCVEALRLLGVTEPDHQIFSHRGFFSLFLANLTPDNMHDTSPHPGSEEFREVRRLLAVAGLDKLRQLLAQEQTRRRMSSRSSGVYTTGTKSGQIPANIPVSPWRRKALEAQAREERMKPAPKPVAKQRPAQKTGVPGGGKPLPKKTAPPPKRKPEITLDDIGPVRPRRPIPEGAIRNPNPRPLPPKAVPTEGPKSAVQLHSSQSDDGHPRAKYRQFLEPIKPPLEAQERQKQLSVGTTADESIREALKLCDKGYYHDAHYVAADYLANHGLKESVLEACTKIIAMASDFDREQGRAPFNMLWECEELACILARYIPDMSHLSEKSDEQTSRMYRCVKMVYYTWTMHCGKLLEYRFRMTNDKWMRRGWIEPRDFGSLLDIMRTGVHSKLPLDLMRMLYQGVRNCVEIGLNVIAFEDKRGKFEGDVLRIVASPVKETVPDLTFEIYGHIAKAYLLAGDTSVAGIFVDQALLMRKNDRDMMALKEKVEDMRARGKGQGGGTTTTGTESKWED
ncbi:hypothetical protein KQI84_06810 [bacterium]|nr:hypothetical protein [bacterium]